MQMKKIKKSHQKTSRWWNRSKLDVCAGGAAPGPASPAVHLHHKGLLDGDAAAVDDHTLCVGEVPLVGVLQLHGVNHSLLGETHTQGRGGVSAATASLAELTDFYRLSSAAPPTIPSRTLPKTTCFPSNHSALVARMKNCEPLVSGPALAMLTWYVDTFHAGR